MGPITFWSTDECVKKEGNTWKVDFKKLWDHPHLKCQRLEDMETLLIREALDKEDVTKVKEYTITCNLRAKLAEGYKNGTFKPYMAKKQSNFQKKSGTTTTTLTRTLRGGYNKVTDDMKDDKEAYQKYLDEFKEEARYDGYSFGAYFGDKLSEHRKKVKIDTEYKETNTPTTPSRTFWELLFAYPLNSRLKEEYDKRTPDMAVLSHIQKRLKSSRGRFAYIAKEFLDPKLLDIEYTPDQVIKWRLAEIMSVLYRVYFKYQVYFKGWEKEWSRESQYKIENHETYDKYNILLTNIFKDRCLKTGQDGIYFWQGMKMFYDTSEDQLTLGEEDWKSAFSKYPIKPKDFMDETKFIREGSYFWSMMLKKALIEYDCWKESNSIFFGWSISKDKKCKSRRLKL
jgi:hypothetical protein